MSATKRYLEEIQAEEEMNEWIRSQVDLGVEEGDPEWEEFKDEYLTKREEWYEDELEWYSDQQTPFDDFIEQIEQVRTSGVPSSPTTIKMKYAYSVTLMESCLGDMLKSLIFSDERYLVNALNNVTDLKNIKISLIESYQVKDIVKKNVLNTMSGFLYHNIVKIVPIYCSVLGEKTPENIKNKMEEVIKIISIRHDIVHRNGKDTDGNEHELSDQIFISALQNIKDFVQCMHMFVESTKISHIITSSEF